MAFGWLIAGAALFAVSVIFRCLSEDERRTQEEMVKDYNSYRKKQLKNLEENKRLMEEKAEISWLENEESKRKKIEEARNKIRKLNELLYNKTMNKLRDQRKNKIKQREQLRESLNLSNSYFDKTQITYIRSRSMKLEIMQLEEAVEILTAYLSYLDEYEIELKSAYESDSLLPEVFSMFLPEDYPYVGKVYNIAAENIFADNWGNKYIVPRKGKKLSLTYGDNFDINSKDYLLLKKNPGLKEYPMMVIPRRDGEAPTRVSAAKGMLRQSARSCEPLMTEVKEIRNHRNLKLSYFGTDGWMNSVDRKNPYRSAVVGSKKKVYVKEYDYLFWRINFSEKYEDSLQSECFDRLPFIITSEGFTELKKQVTDMGLENSEAEWKIGPAERFGLDTVKIQLGSYYGFLCEFIRTDESVSLRFVRMLSEEELMNADDIFAVVDVSLNARRKYQYTQRDIDECTRLYLFLNREFEMQKALSRSSAISVFLDKWQKLNERMAEFRSCASCIDIIPESWEEVPCSGEERLLTKFFLSETEALKKYAELQNTENASFVISYFSGKGYERKVPCRIFHGDNEFYEIKPLSAVSLTDLVDNDYTLKLIETANAAVWRKQAAAFSDFKMGRCTSIELKRELLSPEGIRFSDSGIRIQSFFNNRIASNESQSYSAAAALRSKDFYIIQGPPGTGKTTVIKELVLQTLSHNCKSRILVVSQANVAVDNVLRGLLSLREGLISPENIVRCGIPEKIAQDISEKCGIEGYRKRYLEDLGKDCRFFRERALWKSIINKNENDCLLMEMMLKKFQVIGVTCVGLSSAMFGLSNNDFDLVIIDEAGKALPGELLIPINHAKKLVIIGDHKQLPPVIDSELYEGGKVKTDDIVEKDERVDFFNKSFFEHLWTGCPDSNKHMLNTQFRMPPIVSGLVNLFYDGKLLDGESCTAKRPMILGSHLIFIDMKNNREYFERQEENGRKTGPFNPAEAEAVVGIAKRLRQWYEGRIVVITPYKEQKRKIIKALREDYTESRNISVDTIDAFQGDEEDIVIFCTTRSKRVTEFFGDDARLNVAFSRARNTLIIIGDSRYFSKYKADRKIHQVDKYLKQYAKTIPYSEFVSPDTDLLFDSGYAGQAVNQVKEETLPVEQLNILIDSLAASVPSIRYCKICKRELREDEDELCLGCRMSKEITEPLKLTWVKCQQCGKEFSMTEEQLAKNDGKPYELCWDCSNKDVVVGHCQSCGKEISMPEWKRRKYYKDKKITLCNNCRNAQKYSVGKSGGGDKSKGKVKVNVNVNSGDVEIRSND